MQPTEITPFSVEGQESYNLTNIENEKLLNVMRIL